jgi:hypothetical protein
MSRNSSEGHPKFNTTIPWVVDINLANDYSAKGTPAFIAFAGGKSHPLRFDPDTFKFANWRMTLSDFLNNLANYYSGHVSTWQYILGPLDAQHRKAYDFLGESWLSSHGVVTCKDTRTPFSLHNFRYTTI